MKDEKGFIHYPDEKKVKEIIMEIDEILVFKEAKIYEGLTALIAISIIRAQEAKISKPIFLNYISNTWELNDPENEHPGRDDCSKVNY